MERLKKAMEQAKTVVGGSVPETLKHIEQVAKFLSQLATAMQLRAKHHDKSKMKSPEVEYFDEFTPKLKNSTFGSDEYKSFTKAMAPAIEHHHKENRHHPEYYKEGILGMNLVDVIEMLADWKAATLRHEDGNIMRSLKICSKKYKIPEALQKVLLNTINDFGWAK